MSEETKKCPFCGEEILSVAIKCKHCSSDLSDNAQAIKPTDYGVWMIAIPLIATGLIWGWVAQMNLLQSPGSTLDFILVATIFGTAIVASMEASKAGMKTDRAKGTYSPVAWFVIIVIFWAIGYPAYLLKRKGSGLPNKIGAGLIVVVIFIASYATLASAIENKKAEIRNHLNDLNQQMQTLGN